MNLSKAAFFLSTLVASSSFLSTTAHRPLTTRPSCDDDYGSSTEALTILDPTLSWAFQHYLDCTHRAVWLTFTNPSPEFQFYVGVGVPTLDRFADVRANALIIGPGLPMLNETEFDALPEEIRNDPVWNSGDNIGAYLHKSPADQSTCNHLGTVMQGESSVQDGRCTFFEPFSETNSWRVLDADNNNITTADAEYHVAVYLQDDTRAKIGIAVGTWVEDFRTPFDVDSPSCTRDTSDFYEKDGSQAECFPVVSCPSLTAQDTVGCVEQGSGGNGTNGGSDESVCARGQVCDTAEGCEIAGTTYQEPSMGACGGQKCPAAVQTWERVNMDMHMKMMDLQYTGNADIDFARGMIPHHLGAVDMCTALLEDLTCTEIDSSIDNLQGLVHFCSHVEYEQTIEVGGLRAWLEERGLEETAPCPTATTRGGHMGGDMDGGMMMMDMPESCGNLTTPSATKFVELNDKMHDLMAVEYSCNHTVDFVRMMIPHHAGAIEMCDILVETTEDTYLMDLCNNITLTQRAEIAWMQDWLQNRNLTLAAPCGCDVEDLEIDETIPVCEDLLSTSSFCHGLGSAPDGFCKCKNTVDSEIVAADLTCDSPSYVDGVGVFIPADVCQRTCGMCPQGANRATIWPPKCPTKSDGDGKGDEEGEEEEEDTEPDDNGSNAMRAMISLASMLSAFIVLVLSF